MRIWGKRQRVTIEDAVTAVKEEPIDARAEARAADRVRALLDGEHAAQQGALHGCAEVAAAIPAYRRNELGEARRLLVEDHARECVACRQRLEQRLPARVLALPWSAPIERARASHQGFRTYAVAATLLLAVALGFTWRWFFWSRAESRRAPRPVRRWRAVPRERHQPEVARAGRRGAGLREGAHGRRRAGGRAPGRRLASSRWASARSSRSTAARLRHHDRARSRQHHRPGRQAQPRAPLRGGGQHPRLGHRHRLLGQPRHQRLARLRHRRRGACGRRGKRERPASRAAGLDRNGHDRGAGARRHRLEPQPRRAPEAAGRAGRAAARSRARPHAWPALRQPADGAGARGHDRLRRGAQLRRGAGRGPRAADGTACGRWPVPGSLAEERPRSRRREAGRGRGEAARAGDLPRRRDPLHGRTHARTQGRRAAAAGGGPSPGRRGVPDPGAVPGGAQSQGAAAARRRRRGPGDLG